MDKRAAIPMLAIAVGVFAAPPSASAQSVAVNDSFIQQVGDLNTAGVKQVGGGNTQVTLQGLIDTSALAGIPHTGTLSAGPSFGNIANTTQLANPANGGSNNSTTIQLGAGANVSNVMQVALLGGTNNALTIQNGAGNSASTTQIAHAGLTNSSAIVQMGSHNTATVTQR